MAVYEGGFYKLQNNQILEIHDCMEGYDFSLYQENGDLIDGGIIDSYSYLNEHDVVIRALNFLNQTNTQYTKIEDMW